MYFIATYIQIIKFLIKLNVYFSEYKQYCLQKWIRVRVVNATFNNISIISWWSVFLVEETGVPGENHPTFCYK